MLVVVLRVWQCSFYVSEYVNLFSFSDGETVGLISTHGRSLNPNMPNQDALLIGGQ